ncbi:MAG: class I SAM-dependent methyltransferase [Armatimonadetes bacterium]|nr:class I SAM-dependent methyltransferase [Armatimonadota bacterium]
MYIGSCKKKTFFILDLLKRFLKHPVFRPTRFYYDWELQTNIIHYHKTLHWFLIHETSSSFLILDLGSGNRKLSERTISFDIIFYPLVDVVGDAHALPFKTNSFDRVVVQEVLEHVRHPEKVLIEVKRVLKPKGRIYVEVPLIYPIHDKVDYWRFTPSGLDILCRDYFKPLRSGVVMGGSSAISVVLRNYFAIIFSQGRKGFRYNLGWFIGGLLTFWLKYLDELVKLQDNPLIGMVAAAHYWIGEKQ